MPTILIVDDEEDIRELIAVNLMREESYKLVEAENGLEALKMAKNATIQSEIKRAKLVARYAARRAELNGAERAVVM